MAAAIFITVALLIVLLVLFVGTNKDVQKEQQEILKKAKKVARRIPRDWGEFGRMSESERQALKDAQDPRN